MAGAGKRPDLVAGGMGGQVTVVIDSKKRGDSIGAGYETWLDAERLIERGLPFGAIERLAGTTGMTYEQIKKLVGLTGATFLRRRQAGKLSPAESERVLRVSRLFEQAVDLFGGDQAGAQKWLDTPLPVLGDRPPIALARTEVGAREVEDLIGRIQHGVIS
jgi:putative toxin-antitoxin system antitoxin component (TIGR02293 family)